MSIFLYPLSWNAARWWLCPVKQKEKKKKAVLCERHANSSGDVEIVQEAFWLHSINKYLLFSLLTSYSPWLVFPMPFWSELQDHSGVPGGFQKCSQQLKTPWTELWKLERMFWVPLRKCIWNCAPRVYILFIVSLGEQTAWSHFCQSVAANEPRC